MATQWRLDSLMSTNRRMSDPSLSKNEEMEDMAEMLYNSGDYSAGILQVAIVGYNRQVEADNKGPPRGQEAALLQLLLAQNLGVVLDRICAMLGMVYSEDRAPLFWSLLAFSRVYLS